MGRPETKHVWGKQFLLGFSYGSSRPKCLTDCRTHRAGALRTERDKGATHTSVVTEAKVGVTEGDHGVRRGPPTNSGETAEVNGQISKQATSLQPPPQPLSPPVMDTHYLPSVHWLLGSSHRWKALPHTEPKSVLYSPRQSSFNPLDHAEPVCPLPPL